MNPLLDKPSEFSSLLQRFFLERLMQQRNASPRTVESYRDTFRLLLSFAEQHIKKSPAKISLEDFNAPLILNFLDYLENERHNCIRSRNARLAAIHSFSKYVALQCPHALWTVQQILAVPAKRYEKPMFEYLSVEEFHALLAAPDLSSWFGHRDRTMLGMLYNTAARVSELINIRISDISMQGAPSVRLHGKGRKQRTLPLWKETALQIRQWLAQQNLQPTQPLLPNRYGQPMTRANVAGRVALAVKAAQKQCPQLSNRHITPHSIRHTVGMHLLQSGIDITVIALWLGHENLTTTHGYAELDLEMKQRVLARIKPPAIKKTHYQPPQALLNFLQSL